MVYCNPDRDELTQEKVITQDNVAIAYDYYQGGFERLIIIAPGFYNSKEALLLRNLSKSLAQDYDVISMDFRGHGKSEGLFYWTSKEYLDLLAIVERFKEQYRFIGVIGFSLGAATSIIAASKTDAINSLILVSAPTAFEEIEYRLWELDFENDIRYSLLAEGRVGKGVRPGPFWYKKERPIDLVGRLIQPVLYIHGTDDWIIKPWHSKALFDKTRSMKSLEIIQDGPHAEYLLRNFNVMMLGHIHQWFKQS